jgi:hypothetical protein
MARCYSKSLGEGASRGDERGRDGKKTAKPIQSLPPWTQRILPSHERERYIDKTEIQAEQKAKNQRKEYRTTEAGCLASSITKARQRDDSTMTSAKGK